MAKWSKLKKRYIPLRRFLSGLTAVCVILTLVGTFFTSRSAVWAAVWAFIVAVGLAFISRLLISLWASWEDVQKGAETD